VASVETAFEPSVHSETFELAHLASKMLQNPGLWVCVRQFRALHIVGGEQIFFYYSGNTKLTTKITVVESYRCPKINVLIQ
jgi:hypothetical protein